MTEDQIWAYVLGALTVALFIRQMFLYMIDRNYSLNTFDFVSILAFGTLIVAAHNGADPFASVVFAAATATAAYPAKFCVAAAVRFIRKAANTRLKRIAAIALPFALTVSAYLLHDEWGYRWEPTLAFTLSAMLTVLCGLLAFTSLSDWLRAD